MFEFKPNNYQTTTDFFKNVEWLRLKKYNAFIYPTFVEYEYNDLIYRKYTGFYPLNPDAFNIQYAKDKYLVTFNFNNNFYTLNYDDIIHLKWRRGLNNFSGGDDFGNPDDKDVLKTLNSLNSTIENIPKSLSANLNLRGLFKANSNLSNEKLKQSREDFEKSLKNSPNGIAAIDISGDFVPINSLPVNLPNETMKFLKNIIYEKYGVSEAILSGDYTAEQYSSFYETCIEDFFLEFEQAMSKCVFTKRELDIGHKIKLYYNKANLMSNNHKIEIAKIATATGLLNKNEIRELFGYPSIEDGDIYLQSLNYVDADLANDYQKGKAGVKTET